MNMFCQSLSPSLYRGSTVLNFIYYFSKSEAAPSPCAGPALAWLRIYNTPKLDYAKSGNNKIAAFTQYYSPWFVYCNHWYD